MKSRNKPFAIFLKIRQSASTSSTMKTAQNMYTINTLFAFLNTCSFLNIFLFSLRSKYQQKTTFFWIFPNFYAVQCCANSLLSWIVVFHFPSSFRQSQAVDCCRKVARRALFCFLYSVSSKFPGT